MSSKGSCMGSGRTVSMSQADVERHKKGVRLVCPVCGRRVRPKLIREPDGSYEGELPEHESKQQGG